MEITHPGTCIAHLGSPVGALSLYIFFFSLGRQASRQKCTDWKNGSIHIHFAQAGHFDEKFQIFFWPHVVPKWNPNIAWGSLSWFRSIRVRGLAVMGVWKCVNNSIYESPVTTQAKWKSITNLNQWSGCKWPSRSSGVLPPSDCWPKFSDQNFLTEMCIENSLLSALYIFTFIETI